MENVDNQQNNNPKKLGGITGKGFMPGQSGNLAGRPKGKTMKEFAREWLLSMTEEEKHKWLGTLGQDTIWKMAEGMPKQDTEATVKGEITINLVKYGDNNSTSL